MYDIHSEGRSAREKALQKNTVHLLEKVPLWLVSSKLILFGAFLCHGGTSIAGWFLSWTIPSRNLGIGHG